MKKKIKDLTLEECKKICENNNTCTICPMGTVCYQTPIYYEDEDLEQEVEVPEDAKEED